MVDIKSADDAPTTHPHDDDLQEYVRGRLKAQQASSLEDHALDCPRCQGKITEAARFLAQLSKLSDRHKAYATEEKRLGQRFRVTGIGSLHVLTPLERDHCVVRIMDVSVTGLGVRLQKSLEPGALVQVHFGKVVVLGEVRHCRHTENEFHVGILVQHAAVLGVESA